MTTPSSQYRIARLTEVATSHEIRALIAEHLGVDVENVTDEAHFVDDLGADWFDRIELMIAVEDQFADVEITDKDVDQITVVGDLIRHVESVARRTRRTRLAWTAAIGATTSSR